MNTGLPSKRRIAVRRLAHLRRPKQRTTVRRLQLQKGRTAGRKTANGRTKKGRTVVRPLPYIDPKTLPLRAMAYLERTKCLMRKWHQAACPMEARGKAGGAGPS